MNPAHNKARCNAPSAAIRMAVLVRIECSGSYAWIGGQQHDVGDQVASYNKEGGQHKAANHKIEVAGERGFQDERPEARPAADDFSQQRATYQAGQRESE